VFIFSSTSEPVGVSKNTLSLAKSLVNRGYDVRMLTLNAGWLTNECADLGIPIEVFKFTSAFKSVFMINFYLMFFLKNRSDVCLHMNGRATLFSSLLILCLKRKVGYCYSVRQFSCVGDPGLFFWKVKLETFLMRRTQTLLHAVSIPLVNETRRRISEKKDVEYIPNFLSDKEAVDTIKTSDNCRKKDFKFIYAGRLSREKGVDILIEAINLVLNEAGEDGVSLSLDIYGSGSQHGFLSTLIKKYSLDSVVNLKGQCDNARRYFYNYDAVIIPSRSESFGLVAIEAFAEGLPVIASDVPGLCDVVGDSALIFDAENPKQLAQEIIRFCKSFSMRESLRRKGIARFKEFTQSKVIPMFEELYKRSVSINSKG
jgi:glycosyltransferase involved in cell wall biosynthesis